MRLISAITVPLIGGRELGVLAIGVGIAGDTVLMPVGNFAVMSAATANRESALAADCAMKLPMALRASLEVFPVAIFTYPLPCEEI